METIEAHIQQTCIQIAIYKDGEEFDNITLPITEARVIFTEILRSKRMRQINARKTKPRCRKIAITEGEWVHIRTFPDAPE